jgi:signal peptidase I
LPKQPIHTKKQLAILISVIVMILAIRSSIVEPFRIPTRSMLPGLFTGDFLFVNKMSYGFHLPFTELLTGAPVFLGKQKLPHRGEIIIFTPPEAGQESLYIKRVVGMPGDKIQFFKKNLWINGSPVHKEEILGSEREELFNHNGFDPEDRYQKKLLHLYRESFANLGDKKSYLTLEDDSFETRHDQLEVIVPPDHLFVLGDNRDDTRDSRFFGVIPLTSVRGRAFVIWLSYRIAFGSGRSSLRMERIGKTL